MLFLGLLVFTSLILIRYFLCDCFGTAITAKIVGREELQILRVSLFDSEDYNFRLVIEYKGTNGKTYRSKFSVSRYVYENRCIGDDIHVFRYKKYAVSKLL